MYFSKDMEEALNVSPPCKLILEENEQGEHVLRSNTKSVED